MNTNRQLDAKLRFGLPDPVPPITKGEAMDEIINKEWPLFEAYQKAKISVSFGDKLRLRLLMDLGPYMMCEAHLYDLRADKVSKISALLTEHSVDWVEIKDENLRNAILNIINEY